MALLDQVHEVIRRVQSQQAVVNAPLRIELKTNPPVVESDLRGAADKFGGPMPESLADIYRLSDGIQFSWHAGTNKQTVASGGFKLPTLKGLLRDRKSYINLWMADEDPG